MAKRRTRRKSKESYNPFKGNIFNKLVKKFSFGNDFKYVIALVAFVLFVTLMNGGSYTGYAIRDVTGAASGIAPITDMLKDLVTAIIGKDGIVANVAENLTTGATWLPAVAIVMIISVLFYILLRKSILPGDQHKKALFILSLGLGLLSIGITINDKTLVDWFKNLISGTVSLVITLVLGFAFWIFALWGVRKSSKAWGKMHEASGERLQLRRGHLEQRSEKDWEKSTRAQQIDLNRIVAVYAAKYKNERDPKKKSDVEKEFRTQVAKKCPDIEPGQILGLWKAQRKI